jgi:N-methylhydantoinase A
MGYRLGVDIGGTFTDAILIDEESGAFSISKVSTTPSDPSVGFLHAADRILAQAEADPASLRYVVHGTTVATNAIIQRKIARTALITTEGFRDVLEIGRQIRPSLYDIQFEKPVPLVPRPLAFGIPERLDWRGEVLVPLDEDAVRDVARRLGELGVESVAVCLLHAYANPVHEEHVGRILDELLPDVAVSLSSNIVPEFREYDRASTVVINAGIQPIVKEYLGSIEGRLRDRGVGAELLVMQSGGGVLTFESAGERPVFIVESGPAAGVIATSHLARTLGLEDAISFDMGGTTAKVGLVRGGSPQITKQYHVGSVAQPGAGAARGSGYPIRTPVIELAEIGAGGGSIAWVDTGGALRVGPVSAGAEPGPAAYGHGGQEPTVTDANLVLGRLSPESFLGGELRLDVDAAEKAIRDRCADPLGLDLTTAAYGIVEIANAAMASALRLMSVQRGLDPRVFGLVGFGGAGPVHVNRLAAEMGIVKAIVPPSPGTFSALGLLLNDLRHDFSQTFLRRTETADVAAIGAVFDRLETEGRAMLRREGVADEDVRIELHAEMQYVGQSYVLPIEMPAGGLDPDALAAAATRFHAAHERAYGFSAPAEPTEIVNLRLGAIGRIPPWEPRTIPADGRVVEPRTVRDVYFAEAGGFTPTAIYDRATFTQSTTLAGPCIVEEMDSTTVIHPGYRADLDAWGNLVIAPTSGDQQR